MRQIFFKNVLRPEDLHVLEALPHSIHSNFYLAGGTGLALLLGHRSSFDLDFFSEKTFRNDLIKRDLDLMGYFEIFQDSAGTLEGAVGITRLTFLQYPYPVIGPESNYGNIRIASIADIAAMKLSAVSSRGSRKDFIDLFFIKDIMEWPDIVEAHWKKYRNSQYNLYHVIKSLGWFDDAEKDPMPMMIEKCMWDDVKKYFMDRQKDMAKTIPGGRLDGSA
jgi:hypothetical protein